MVGDADGAIPETKRKENFFSLFFFFFSGCSLREEEEEEEQEGKDFLQRRRRREREEKEEKEEEETVGRVVEVRIFSFNLMMCFLLFFNFQNLLIKLVFCSFFFHTQSLFSLFSLSFSLIS